jgi:hypothetical protein
VTEDDDDKVNCSHHGPSSPATFVCSHLADGPAPGFVFDEEEGAEYPWPDAYCDECAGTAAMATEELRVLCKYCWEDSFARSSPIEPHDDPQQWLQEARHRASEKQDRWLDRFGIAKYPHYQMELEGELAWLGFGESEHKIHVTSDALVIGSWGESTKTWLWGWANPAWRPEITYPLVRVKRLGEQKGLEPLWRASQDLESEDEAFAIAAAVLDIVPAIEGIYRAPTDTGSLFLAVQRTRRVS